MKIIHTADLHLGQIIYQNYDRKEEHLHFFKQLAEWCKAEKPDALLVCGDVFDIQQPSAAVKKMFNDQIVKIHAECPSMHIVVVAGNHDSASRLQADSPLWNISGMTLIGTAPSFDIQDRDDEWQKQYVVELDSGYIVAMPYMNGNRKEQIQSVLDYVATVNKDDKPVVMTGHMAITGADFKGHDFHVGNLQTLDIESAGVGYDYLALGHIHRPQTLDKEEVYSDDVTYPSPVARYSGAALHVSCDEKYPHTVSMVEIDRHGGNVHIRELRIDELLHFYELPNGDDFFQSADAVLEAIDSFIDAGKSGYIRLKVDHAVDLPVNFDQLVYDKLATTQQIVRYNPKIIWSDAPSGQDQQEALPQFDIPELQQMSDPLEFVLKTFDQYEGLDEEEVKKAFEEVRERVKLMQD